MSFRACLNCWSLNSNASTSSIFKFTLAISVVALMVSGCGGVDDGLTKFPVQGTVLVGGAPQKGVRVRYFRDGKVGTTNADTPSAVTDAEGRFQLSTNGDGDGAVAGTYKVTFFWKESNAPGTPDLLGGKYTKLEKSEFKTQVVDGTNEPVFELEAPETTEAAPKKSKGRGFNAMPPAVRGSITK